MDVQMESTGMDLALETGNRQVTLRFLGAGVTFDALGLPVTADRWRVVLTLDEQDTLQAIGLELDGLDAQGIEHLGQAVTLPPAAFSGAGAETVRLHLRPELVDAVVRPAMTTLASPAGLLELVDRSGQPIFFNLSHFDLQDVTPVQ